MHFFNILFMNLLHNFKIYTLENWNQDRRKLYLTESGIEKIFLKRKRNQTHIDEKMPVHRAGVFLYWSEKNGRRSWISDEAV